MGVKPHTFFCFDNNEMVINMDIELEMRMLLMKDKIKRLNKKEMDKMKNKINDDIKCNVQECVYNGEKNECNYIGDARVSPNDKENCPMYVNGLI